MLWDAPTTRADGSALTPATDLQEYRVYWGTQSGVYGAPVSVPPTQTAVTLGALGIAANGTYFAVATAVDHFGQESDASNELRFVVDSVQPPVTGTLFVDASVGNDANPGTSGAPFASIVRAAQLAQAGDVVVVRPGTYVGDILVHGTGTQAAPIVFQVETPGTVVIEGHVRGANFPAESLTPMTANPWVTWRGFTVRNGADGPGSSLDCLGGISVFVLSEGWRLDGLTVEFGQQGVWIQGNDSVIENCVFQDLARYAIQGTASRVTIRNNIIRRINAAGTIQPACGAVTKIVFSDGYLVEGNESYDNVGPGFWFDGFNTNYVIKDNYFHDNVGRDAFWEGAGCWVELNPASNGQIFGNRFENNTGTGLGILETVGCEVHDNVFVGNDQPLMLRNLNRGSSTVLRDIAVHHNTFEGAWTGGAISTLNDIAGWSASTHNITVDADTYVDPAGRVLIHWLGTNYVDLPTIRSQLGFEINGQVQIP